MCFRGLPGRWSVDVVNRHADGRQFGYIPHAGYGQRGGVGGIKHLASFDVIARLVCYAGAEFLCSVDRLAQSENIFVLDSVRWREQFFLGNG